MTIFAHRFLVDFWRNQSNRKGSNPANGIDPNFSSVQKFLSDSNNKNTHGLIPRFFESINSQTIAIILNALYFKGLWSDPFDKANTSKAEFKGMHQTCSVDMMNNVLKTAYYKASGYVAVWLSYGNAKYSMMCVLPDEGIILDDLLASEELKNKSLKPRLAEVTLKLPKFTIAPHEKTELGEIFTSMGYDNFESQLVSILDSPTEVKIKYEQKVFIEVDEDGTKAAAVTSAGMETIANIPEKVTLTFDRPFVFFIRENTNGMILFAGKVVDL